MIEVETMPSMETLMDRQRLVGWIVRDAIINTGSTYSKASRRWPISLPTLNRLMSTGNVQIRFYRLAEVKLGLPHGLLEMVIDGDVEGISKLDIEEPTKTYILTEMGATPPAPRRRRKA